MILHNSEFSAACEWSLPDLHDLSDSFHDDRKQEMVTHMIHLLKDLMPTEFPPMLFHIFDLSSTKQTFVQHCKLVKKGKNNQKLPSL